MIPGWLKRARGDATRAVTICCCEKCAAPILVGLDADVCALLVRVDPTPLDEIGEAIALVTNRATYDLAKGPKRKELWPREPQHIRAPRRHPVLPAHKCGQPLPAATDNSAAQKGQPHARPPF